MGLSLCSQEGGGTDLTTSIAHRLSVEGVINATALVRFLSMFVPTIYELCHEVAREHVLGTCTIIHDS